MPSYPTDDFRLYDPADHTKVIIFDASGLSTDTTRILTAPDQNVVVGGVGGAASANVGQATIPFATFKNEDSIAVVGQSALSGNSRISATLFADNDEVSAQGWLSLVIGSVIAGTGFTITLRTDYGTFKGPVKINWGWQ